VLVIGAVHSLRISAPAIALANTAAKAAHLRLHLDRLMKDSQPGDGVKASA